MKASYAAHHREVHFQVGEKMLLCLHPYCQLSLKRCPYNKMAPRFYGSFQVLERIGSVAYHLALPENSCLHQVFHVSYLNFFYGNEEVQPSLSPLFDGELSPKPQAILDQ